VHAQSDAFRKRGARSETVKEGSKRSKERDQNYSFDIDIQTDNGRKKFGVRMIRPFQIKTSIL